MIGNLGDDPSALRVIGGTDIATTGFSLATREQWKDRTTGEKKERTEWHKISIVGRLAETACEYLKKGSKVYLEGRLKTRSWVDDDGAKKYITEIFIDFDGVLQMLDGSESTKNQKNASNESTANKN